MQKERSRDDSGADVIHISSEGEDNADDGNSSNGGQNAASSNSLYALSDSGGCNDI